MLSIIRKPHGLAVLPLTSRIMSFGCNRGSRWAVGFHLATIAVLKGDLNLRRLFRSQLLVASLIGHFNAQFLAFAQHGNRDFVAFTAHDAHMTLSPPLENGSPCSHPRSE